MKRILLVGIFILITLFSFSAEVIRYVDPDATGAADGTSWTDAYTSLSAWEAAEGTNLVTDGDWHHVYCRASSGSADTTGFQIQGWITDSTHYIYIEAADGDQALKTGWDTARYRYQGASGSRSGYVVFDGIQFECNAYAYSIQVDNFGSAGTVTIKNCRFNTSNSGVEPIEINLSTIDFVMYNTIIDGSQTNDHGIQIIDSNSALIYNNVIRNRTNGIIISANTNGTIIKNNAIFSCTDDINDSDTSTIDYNASDDGDGTNAVAASGSDWDNEYTDSANGDFTLINTGNTYHGGADNPSSGLYTTDMEGDAYNSGAYSIGVDEYVAAGGGVIHPVISSDGIQSIIFGGQILTSLLFLWDIVLSISLIYTFWKLQYWKNKTLFYNDPDNVQALAELNRYIEGGK